jgi:S1-C subfamily serine protease
MSGRFHSRLWVLALGLLALSLVGLGCSLPSLLGVAPAATVAPATGPTLPATPVTDAASLVQATPTVAPPPLTPIPDEIEAANILEAQVIAVYENVGPAVVNITNRSIGYDMFMQPVPQEGSGSGFVYDDQGHIVTNYHVIEGAEELLVNLADGEEYQAEIVGTDPVNDLAVIRIDAGDHLPSPVAIGDSDRLRVGQFVVAIGNPFGLEQTLTTGVVSALGRIIQSPEDNRFIGEAIQTDAAINPGNSGGPLLDLQGRVIGVNSQIISPSGASAGIGFAVSVNTVTRVVPQLIAKGYYAHPWLGTDMLPLSASVVNVLRDAGVNLDSETGLLVLSTTAGGPADRAGIEGGSQWLRYGRYQLPVGGDIITAVDGRPTNDLETLTVYLETEKAIGDTVQLTILRDGQQMTIDVTLEEQPQA